MPFESAIDPSQTQNIGPDLLAALGMLARGVDIPRQAVLQHAMGGAGNYGDALGQVLDPSKILRGQDVVQKQLPSLINRSPLAATAVGTALEFADPLVAFGAAKPALGAAIGLGEVGGVGEALRGKAGGLFGLAKDYGAKKVASDVMEFSGVGKVPSTSTFSTYGLRAGLRGFVTNDGKVVAGTGGQMHNNVAEAAGFTDDSFDMVRKGHVRFELNPEGSAFVHFRADAPGARDRAKRLLQETVPPGGDVWMDADFGSHGAQEYKHFEGSLEDALDTIDNIETYKPGVMRARRHADVDAKSLLDPGASPEDVETLTRILTRSRR